MQVEINSLTFPLTPKRDFLRLHFKSSQRSHGGVDRNYDTPHTSLSVWALLDEGALFDASSPLLSDEIDCPN